MKIDNTYMLTVIHKLLEDIKAKEFENAANGVKVQMFFGREEAQVLYDALLTASTPEIKEAE